MPYPIVTIMRNIYVNRKSFNFCIHYYIVPWLWSVFLYFFLENIFLQFFLQCVRSYRSYSHLFVPISLFWLKEPHNFIMIVENLLSNFNFFLKITQFPHFSPKYGKFWEKMLRSTIFSKSTILKERETKYSNKLKKILRSLF